MHRYLVSFSILIASCALLLSPPFHKHLLFYLAILYQLVFLFCPSVLSFRSAPRFFADSANCFRVLLLWTSICWTSLQSPSALLICRTVMHAFPQSLFICRRPFNLSAYRPFYNYSSTDHGCHSIVPALSTSVVWLQQACASLVRNLFGPHILLLTRHHVRIWEWLPLSSLQHVSHAPIISHFNDLMENSSLL